ncbi:hypothetical protein AG1IA_07480 [Rhizoctonia solani AG-1 IA]|uniref:Uncharacterized protein n=1 Tax=Thanatephorus cucumeris (strain AG1-IA) TaxID=983506 RepID=L8WP01_THACA|nr:hypothetical protein AG1IA_07480 [Rhizoctonia solani AG-1 IA]
MSAAKKEKRKKRKRSGLRFLWRRGSFCPILFPPRYIRRQSEEERERKKEGTARSASLKHREYHSPPSFIKPYPTQQSEWSSQSPRSCSLLFQISERGK